MKHYSILIFLLMSCSAQKSAKEFGEKQISMTKTTQYTLYDTKNGLERQFVSYGYDKYDKQGRLMKDSEWMGIGLKKEPEDIYDSRGNRVEDLSYDTEGTLLLRVLYTYNDQNKVIKIEKQEGDGTTYSILKSNYNKEGVLLSAIDIDTISQDTFNIVYSYNEKNLITKITETSSTQRYESTFTYEFDDFRNWIKKYQWRKKKRVKEWAREIVYKN